jgi:uncharacterized membrane protein
MSARAAITVDRPPEEVRRLWDTPDHRPAAFRDTDANVTFKPAPGDRGTEIHVEVPEGGPLAQLLGSDPLPKLKDGLRHFKQLIETGEVARSDATPAGESVEAKLKQRPAQPLTPREREEVHV